MAKGKLKRKIEYNGEKRDLVELVEELYTQGYTDTVVAALLGISKRQWYNILAKGKNDSVKNNYYKLYKDLHFARERGIGKHQGWVIQKVLNIISGDNYKDAEFLLKYLESRYKEDFKREEETKIVIEFVKPRLRKVEDAEDKGK
ncbi:MAG: hypothetical protein ABDH28_07495 [Brevinematia bacterium]